MTTTPQASIPASFRDPAGRLFRLDDRILRVVNPVGVPDFQAFAASPAAARLLACGSVVGTRVLPAGGAPECCDCADGGLVLAHDRIPFPSFPYEWPPEMLHRAAALTLDLALELLPDGIGLKDATPYNVLFRGPNPVFIDLLSFERRDPLDPSWLPYAQFIRTFLLPLLANKRFSLSLDQLLLTHRDGVEPDEVYHWASPLERLTPPLLTLASIPTWLGKRQKRKQDDFSVYRHRAADSPEKASFIVESILKALRRQLAKAAPVAGKASTWSDYLDSNNNYSAEHFAAKKAFVEWAMAEFRPASALDVGCNTGFFSSIAARSGARVVAIDYDPVVVGETWRSANEQRLDILPLVVDLTRPTPGVGWRNSECPSFLDRARGAFDAVIMLAVIHHMLVTERIPLEEIIDMAAELTTDVLIVEFIAPQDSMFKRLLRGRDALHQGLDCAAFEAAAGRRFRIARVEHVEGASRWLYALRKRPE